MKKTVSLILVLAMLLSMSLAASALSFAADSAEPKAAEINATFSDGIYFTYEKNQEYTVVKKGETPDWNNPAAPEVSEDETGAQYSSLEGATEYELYTRIKAEGKNAASKAVSTEFMTLLSSAGINFSSDYGYVVGATITVEPEGEPEGLNYQWCYYTKTEHEEGYYTTNYEDIEGATDVTYALEEKDYGKTLAVKILKGEKELMTMDDLGPVMTEEEVKALIEESEEEISYLESEINVAIMGDYVLWTDVVPFIDSNNRTMVPLRAVAEAMMLDVEWDAENRVAKFSSYSYDEDSVNTISFPIDSKEALFELTKDGETVESGKVEMDTEAVIVDSRTYAPIRYLAEYFGYTVDWDAATKTVLITEEA